MHGELHMCNIQFKVSYVKWSVLYITFHYIGNFLYVRPIPPFLILESQLFEFQISINECMSLTSLCISLTRFAWMAQWLLISITIVIAISAASCKALKASAVILMCDFCLSSISFAISLPTNLMKLQRGMHISIVFYNSRFFIMQPLLVSAPRDRSSTSWMASADLSTMANYIDFFMCNSFFFLLFP